MRADVASVSFLIREKVLHDSVHASIGKAREKLEPPSSRVADCR